MNEVDIIDLMRRISISHFPLKNKEKDAAGFPFYSQIAAKKGDSFPILAKSGVNRGIIA